MNIGSSKTARRETVTLTADTSHGVYDALPVCDEDEPPTGAVLAVFHEDGYLAGFAAPEMAWDARGRRISLTTLEGAVSLVADRDELL